MSKKPGILRSLGIVAFAVLGCGLARASGGADVDPYARVRGMTVSCHGAGREWGSDEMVRTMEQLKALGVNWIAIHPYAPIRDDGTVGGAGRHGVRQMYADPTWLTRPIAEAHRLGLKIMIKPHVAYWGSRFSWRGEIAFDDDAGWRRFFDTYERWITFVARLTREADAFVVGTELDRTLRHEEEWRRIVRAVRAETAAPLTYSAGWDHYEEVGFWDALDAISIQGYFPLVDHDGLPAQHELDEAWQRLTTRLEEFGRRHSRNVVLGELGYNLSRDAARRPWDYTQGGEDAEEVQRRCLDAALRALGRSEIVVGAFLWKWFPGETGGHGNFLQSTAAMRAVIAAHW